MRKHKLTSPASCLQAIALICFLLGASASSDAQAPRGADSLLSFLSTNRTRSAFTLNVNDMLLARLNENNLMPLASTMKIMVAVEYAKQAGNGVLDPHSRVGLSELEKYYLPMTDGGAHSRWLAYERESGHISGDSIELRDVARGMMMFSSNANTEYLMDLLGLDNINNNLPLFGLKQHTKLFPVVASLFLYQNPKKLKEKNILRSIDQLTEEAYCQIKCKNHKQIKHNIMLKKKLRNEDLSTAMQQLWSDRLTAATTKEYTQVMATLNNRRFLDESSYGMLADVMEFPMENPGNRAIYRHIALKGGSTSSVLTFAIYATQKDSTRIEAACFFNKLTQKENDRLAGWLNDFLIGLTQDPGFRKKVAFSLQEASGNSRINQR